MNEFENEVKVGIEEDKMLAYDIYLRLSLARLDLDLILEKHGDELGLSQEGQDIYYWIDDIRHRSIDAEREVAIANPYIVDYVDEDIK